MPTNQPKWDTITIVGVGLIGGSIGLALKKRGLARRIIGVGRRQASLDLAIGCGAIDEGVTDVSTGVAEAHLVVICTPVDKIVSHVLAAGQACREGALITDAGSTKEAIVREVEKATPSENVSFVGSHPLAGSEKTGCENGEADLFLGRTCVVTPTSATRAEDCQAIIEFWQSIGMNVEQMTPADHDAALACTSHLPHVVASALAFATSEDQLPLVAGGWLDTTRIAAADPQLWRQILLDNQQNTLAALDEFQSKLNGFRDAIAESNGPALEQLLENGKQRRDSR